MLSGWTPGSLKSLQKWSFWARLTQETVLPLTRFTLMITVVAGIILSKYYDDYDCDDKHLLWARLYAESRAGIYTFILHNSQYLMRELLAFIPFYRWWNWSSACFWPRDNLHHRLGRRGHGQGRRKQPPLVLSFSSGRRLPWEHVSCLLVGSFVSGYEPLAWRIQAALIISVPPGSLTPGLAFRRLSKLHAFLLFSLP